MSEFKTIGQLYDEWEQAIYDLRDECGEIPDVDLLDMNNLIDLRTATDRLIATLATTR